MALIITVILLAVVTFMALTFLAVSRRERGAVTTTTDTASARLAADDALASAEAEIVANVLATTNPYNFGLLVSTNYINSFGFRAGVASPTNVNYTYYNTGPGPLTPNDFLQNLANLSYLPRAPVLISATDPVQGRFYLNLNQTAASTPTASWAITTMATFYAARFPKRATRNGLACCSIRTSRTGQIINSWRATPFSPCPSAMPST